MASCLTHRRQGTSTTKVASPLSGSLATKHGCRVHIARCEPFGSRVRQSESAIVAGQALSSHPGTGSLQNRSRREATPNQRPGPGSRPACRSVSPGLLIYRLPMIGAGALQVQACPARCRLLQGELLTLPLSAEPSPGCPDLLATRPRARPPESTGDRQN
jgi:hypothetical protein